LTSPSGGPLGPVELGARLGLRSASATALVDRLEAMGHVERRPHPSDRRRLVVVPTEHARREAAGALQPLIDGLDEVAAGMTEAEQEVVRRYLERAAAAMRDYRPPAR
jgi:DNA-binding MarR family transcriptional regulator